MVPPPAPGVREGDVIVAVNFAEVATRAEIYRPPLEAFRRAPSCAWASSGTGSIVIVEVASVDRAEFYR